MSSLSLLFNLRKYLVFWDVSLTLPCRFSNLLTTQKAIFLNLLISMHYSGYFLCKRDSKICFSFLWKCLLYKMKLLHFLSSGYSGITFPCFPKDALPSPLPTAAEKTPTSTRDQQVATVSETQQWTVAQSAELSTTGKKQNKKIDNHWSVDTKRMNKTSHWPRALSSWWTSKTSPLNPRKKGRLFIFQTFHCFYQFKFHHNSKHNSNFHFCLNSTRLKHP